MIQSLLLNRSLNLFANRMLGQRVSIFTLHRPRGKHGLTGTDPEMLATFLSKLHKFNCEFVYLDDLLNSSFEVHPSKHYVCLTIDDGYRDQVETLLPIMLEHDAKPTMFVITNLIESRELPWDAIIASLVNQASRPSADITKLKGIETGNIDLSSKRQVRRALSNHVKRLSSSDRETFVEDLISILSPTNEVSAESFRSSSWEELKSLEAQGLSIGSHTCSHQPLSTLTEDTLIKELKESKRILEEKLTHPSQILCYPVGKKEDYDTRAVKLAKEAGYSGAVTSEPGFFRPDLKGDDFYHIPRMSFPSSIGTAIRYASWFEKLRAIK